MWTQVSGFKFKMALSFRFPSILMMVGLIVILGFHTRAQEYSEAPVLAELVEADVLPQVEERLPEIPMVIEPVERIGTYGGTWNSGVTGPPYFWLVRSMGYEPLVRWNREWTNIIPNVAESFDVNVEGTTFTFELREGMKWSDGEPYTADDIIFWYEDVLMNEELTSEIPGWLTADGEPVVVEKVGDTTVKFTFVAPNGLFLQQLATTQGLSMVSYPRHYLEQFHRAYNPNVEELIEQGNVEGWTALFERKAEYPWFNKDKPSILPWIFTTAVGEGGASQVVAERNPYYWKVDPEGNQLPYIDRFVNQLPEDAEVLLLQTLNGEMDFIFRGIANSRNKAVLSDNMEQGDYRFYERIPTYMNTGLIVLNLTHKDPVKREVFQNKDFRIGLSYAVNRQEMNDLLYLGQTEPWQAAPRLGTAFYNERLAKQYTEYDLELANEHLNKVLPEKDSEGFRLGPDGERFTFALQVFGETFPAMGELLQRYWREVGVDVQLRPQARDLIVTQKQANDHEAVLWFGDAGGPDAILDPRYYFPVGAVSDYAIPWGLWYVNPNAPMAEEPPAAAQQQMELYDQIKATPDQEEQVRLMNELLEISADEFYVIGTLLEVPGYGIVKNNFRNVPTSTPLAWIYPDPGPIAPEQFFIDTAAE